MFGLFGREAERLVTQLDLGFGPKGDAVKEKLLSIGTRAVPDLLKCIENSDGKHKPLARLEAAQLLARIRDERSVEPLIRVLQTSDDDGKKNAAIALGGIGDKRAVEPLIKTLMEQNSSVRSRAMFALAEIRDPSGVGALASVLHKDTQAVYFRSGADFRESADFKSALKALTSIGGPTAINALAGAVDASWPYLRGEITKAIDTLKGTPGRSGVR